MTPSPRGLRVGLCHRQFADGIFRTPWGHNVIRNPRKKLTKPKEA